MNNLNNERLKEISEDGFVEHGDSKAMARELLAYREAAKNPVGFINGAREPVLYGEHIGLAIATHLFAAPQLPAVPDGFVLVPIEPTQEMLDSGECYIEDGFSELDKAYKAMIAAAPKPGGSNDI